MKYPLTFYTDKIRLAGEARGPVILIKPKYKDDKGLHVHELTHVKQWLVVTLLSFVTILAGYFYLPLDLPVEYLALLPVSIAVHGLLYKFIPAYRLWSEVQCYTKQAEYYSADLTPTFAKFIANDYDLDISEEEALELLRK